jgi:hypothetical protein
MVSYLSIWNYLHRQGIGKGRGQPTSLVLCIHALWHAQSPVIAHRSYLMGYYCAVNKHLVLVYCRITYIRLYIAIPHLPVPNCHTNHFNSTNPCISLVELV